MSTGKSQRKEFDEDQKSLIKSLREEGKSTDTIAAILMVGKERVRRHLKENGMDCYQNNRAPRQNVTAEPKDITVDYPDFSQAVCRGVETQAFFIEGQPMGRIARIKHQERIDNAIQICTSCSIQERCLDYALKAEPYGIWGGTTEIEREYLRSKLGINCAREISLGRVARKARLGFQSPSLVASYDSQFGRSKIVKKRLTQGV
jgi:hypothetical protein